MLLDSIDAVEGIIYDDSLVIPRIKNITIDSKNPRLEIELRESEKIGIFTKDNYEEFIKENCIECWRFKRNCKLLKTCKENKIVEEISVSNLSCGAKRVKKKK